MRAGPSKPKRPKISEEIPIDDDKEPEPLPQRELFSKIHKSTVWVLCVGFSDAGPFF